MVRLRVDDGEEKLWDFKSVTMHASQGCHDGTIEVCVPVGSGSSGRSGFGRFRFGAFGLAVHHWFDRTCRIDVGISPTVIKLRSQKPDLLGGLAEFSYKIICTMSES